MAKIEQQEQNALDFSSGVSNLFHQQAMDMFLQSDSASLSRSKVDQNLLTDFQIDGMPKGKKYTAKERLEQDAYAPKSENKSSESATDKADNKFDGGSDKQSGKANANRGGGSDAEQKSESAGNLDKHSGKSSDKSNTNRDADADAEQKPNSAEKLVKDSPEKSDPSKKGDSAEADLKKDLGHFMKFSKDLPAFMHEPLGKTIESSLNRSKFSPDQMDSMFNGKGDGSKITNGIKGEGNSLSINDAENSQHQFSYNQATQTYKWEGSKQQ